MKVDSWKNTEPPDLSSVKIFKGSLNVTWHEVCHAHCGLLNLGNSCYFNATVQALLHIPPFVHLIKILSEEHGRFNSSRCDCVVCSFQATLTNMVERSSTLSHKPLTDKMGVINNRLKLDKQEDALELLQSLLDTMTAQEIERHSKNMRLSFCAKQTTGIDFLFGFWVKTIRVCLGCATTSATFSSQKNVLIPSVGRSIQKGVDAILSGKEIVQDFKCLNCCAKQTDRRTCSRHWEFYTYPKVLIIAVDRFRNKIEDKKDDTPVAVNHKIKVGTATYVLKSSVLHHGPFKSSGHFTCVATCPNGSFVRFNDTMVQTEANGFQMLDSLKSIYIIFYELENNLVKRIKDNSPTKVSPAAKKSRSFEKRLCGFPKHLSPKTSGLSKRLLFGKSVLKLKAPDMENLAKVLPPDNDAVHQTITNSRLLKNLTSAQLLKPKKTPFLSTHDVMQKNANVNQPAAKTFALDLDKSWNPSNEHDYCRPVSKSLLVNPMNKAVPPLTILRSQRTQPKDTASQSSHEYKVRGNAEAGSQEVDSEISGCGQHRGKESLFEKPVPPIKILRTERTQPKQSDSQSSHEYALMHSGHSISQEVDSEISGCGQHRGKESLFEKPVPPIKILRTERTQPKQSDSQSSHEYALMHSGHSISQEVDSEISGCGQHRGKESLFEKPVPPIKILRTERTQPKQSDSQSSHEYALMHSGHSISQDWLNRSCSDIFAEDEAEDFLSFDGYESHSSDEYESQSSDENSAHNNVGDTQNSLNYRSSERVPLDLADEEPEGSPLTVDNATLPGSSHEHRQVPHYNEDDIVLSASDVPGAKLPNPILEENLVKDLKRWLLCHGQSYSGTKAVLIARIAKCMNSPNPPTVKRDVDKGTWIRKKLDSRRMAYNLQCSQVTFPDSGFETFPSRDIPQTFTFGSVFHYLIETRPMLQVDSSSSDDDGDDAIVKEVEVKDPFEDPKYKEHLRAKLLRRGLQYVKSGWVLGLVDTADERYHYVKANVRASMDSHAYWVYITISKISGAVCQATCGYPCPATANGRCSHVSAALLHILAHVHLNGYGSTTSTSRPRVWGRGTLKRNPDAIADRQYDSFKINVKRRSHFDPRPTAAQGGPSCSQINTFLAALQYKEKPCYWQTHLSLLYEDFELSAEDSGAIQENRMLFYEALEELYSISKPHQDYEGSFEISGTEGQGKSDTWKSVRSLHCTGSTSYKVSHMTPKGITNFLRSHLWGLDPFTSKSCNYGTKNEDTAREAYGLQKRKEDNTVEVCTTGLHVHTNYLGLACSLDGMVFSEKCPPCNLEIKCPYTLRKHDPNQFEQVLNQDQLDRFCLRRNASGQLELKQDHSYYYQVQMGMGLTEQTSCDFFVWSKFGSVLITVPFNVHLWEEIRDKMTTLHYKILVPEYFAKKTPRDLPAITLD